MVLNLPEDYFSCRARSISCFTEAYGCAPESGYFLPLCVTTMLHGVPLPPVACAFCTLSSMCASNLPLLRQVANLDPSRPISFAILGRVVSMSVLSFEGVSSNHRSV